jgi:hypothetical protein
MLRCGMGWGTACLGEWNWGRKIARAALSRGPPLPGYSNKAPAFLPGKPAAVLKAVQGIGEGENGPLQLVCSAAGCITKTQPNLTHIWASLS